MGKELLRRLSTRIFKDETPRHPDLAIQCPGPVGCGWREGITEFMEDRLDVIYDEIRDLRAERDRYKAALQKVVGGEVYRECPENYPGERFMWVRGIARRALAEGRDDGT